MAANAAGKRSTEYAKTQRSGVSVSINRRQNEHRPCIQTTTGGTAMSTFYSIESKLSGNVRVKTITLPPLPKNAPAGAAATARNAATPVAGLGK
jgi:hypothetical protein